jgi:hypothetical protein
MRTWTTLTVVAGLALAGCGGGDAGDGVGEIATDTSSQRADVTTTLVTESSPTTDGPTDPAGSTGVDTLDPSDDTLVYVTLGNSLLFTPVPGVMGLYRDRLEEHFGVIVETRDHTRGSQSVHDFLDRLRNDDELRADLGEADVVLMLIPNDEWAEPATTAMGAQGRDPATCGGDDDLQCFRDAVGDYESAVDEVFVELMKLVDPTATLVRVFDCYVFTPGDDDALAVERLGPLWHEGQQHVAQTAARYRITVAAVFDDFMGPDASSQPEAAGLVGVDGVHPTRAGAERITALLVDLGFEPAG